MNFAIQRESVQVTAKFHAVLIKFSIVFHFNWTFVYSTFQLDFCIQTRLGRKLGDQTLSSSGNNVAVKIVKLER